MQLEKALSMNAYELVELCHKSESLQWLLSNPFVLEPICKELLEYDCWDQETIKLVVDRKDEALLRLRDQRNVRKEQEEGLKIKEDYLNQIKCKIIGPLEKEDCEKLQIALDAQGEQFPFRVRDIYTKYFTLKTNGMESYAEIRVTYNDDCGKISANYSDDFCPNDVDILFAYFYRKDFYASSAPIVVIQELFSKLRDESLGILLIPVPVERLSSSAVVQTLELLSTLSISKDWKVYFIKEQEKSFSNLTDVLQKAGFDLILKRMNLCKEAN
ncbi:hypothetical protein Aperf_G00000124926 [Anoplocephala perfoliata]